MGRHAGSPAAEVASHRGTEAFELPPEVDTYTVSMNERSGVTPLNGLRRQGNILVEVGESAFGVHVNGEGEVTVQGLKRVMGKRHEKFVPDGEATKVQDGVLVEFAPDDQSRHRDAFDLATSPNSLSFFPEAAPGAQDVRITTPAGYFEEM